MSNPVVVIVGAGASHASGAYERHEAPPLTKDLFSGPHASELLRNHRLAQKASRVFQREMKADSALVLEQALRQLRTDGNPQHAHQALAVPLYLQELLLRYSRLLLDKAERYDALVEELLKLPTHVHFVSLNYDVLLDNCLSPYFPLRSIEDYVAPQTGRHRKNWSLIKPHGSVNWFVELDERFEPYAPVPDLRIPDGPIACEASDSFELGALRGLLAGKPDAGADRYPVLALPEGPKDRLTLPPEHLSFFRSSLADAPEIDLLVLGYSALDTEVLDLIKAADTKVRRLTVVNRDAETSLEVYDTIRRYGIDPIWSDVFDGSFADWVDDVGLRAWVEEWGGPYESRTDPDRLRNVVQRREIDRRIADRAAADTDWMNRPF